MLGKAFGWKGLALQRDQIEKGLLDTVRTQSRGGAAFVCYLLGVPARGGQKVME